MNHSMKHLPWHTMTLLMEEILHPLHVAMMVITYAFRVHTSVMVQDFFSRLGTQQKKYTLQGINISHQTGSWENHRLKSTFGMGLCWLPSRVLHHVSPLIFFHLSREQMFIDNQPTALQPSRIFSVFIQLSSTKTSVLHPDIPRLEFCSPFPRLQTRSAINGIPFRKSTR